MLSTISRPFFLIPTCETINIMTEYSTMNQEIARLNTTVGIYRISKGIQLPHSNWKLKEDRFVQIKQESNNIIVIDASVGEYGVGVTETEAINDLLSSYAGFRNSLEKRENSLSKDDKNALEGLKDLMEM